MDRDSTTQGEWLLTPQGIAVHQPSAVAVVADLHLGYQEARRQAGDAIPLLDLTDILKPLLMVFVRHEVKGLIVAGDLFEKVFDAALWGKFEKLLDVAKVPLQALIPGNHDRGWADFAGQAPIYPDGVELGGWQIGHGDQASRAPRTVVGHFHPSAFVGGRKVPCYLAGARTLVVPAYSREAAGVNVWHVAAWRGLRCLPIFEGKVLDLGLVPGKPSATKTRNRPRP